MLRSRLPSVRRSTVRPWPQARLRIFAADCWVARHIHHAPSPVSHVRQACKEPLSQGQIRGKKTKTVVKLEDLPQGLVVSESRPSPPEDDVPPYPTVVQQAWRNMQKFDNCVLLTRVGGFYELYFEHAEEYGPLLNLKVAEKKTNAGPVPMAGFPFFQLDRFLKVLVQDLNCHVAIAEEFPNDAAEKVRSGGLMHNRRVARIITPGTLIDENFIDPYQNNYIMAIHLSGDPSSTADGAKETERDAMEFPAAGAATTAKHASSSSIGIAWLDLSTGHFFTQATNMADIGSILTRVAPREIVLDQALESRGGDIIFTVLAEDSHLITYSPRGAFKVVSDWLPMLESELPAGVAAQFTDSELGAGNLLLHYVKDRLQGQSMKLQPPVRHENMHIMTIDKNSMRSLEIKQTVKDGFFRGSLLHAIRRTVTKSGSRLLNEWLSSPSTSLKVINFRQDLVASFLSNQDLRDNIIMLLRRSHDSQRLVQKFALNRGDPDELLRLASTIKATEDIVMQLRRAVPEFEQAEENKDCITAMLKRISLDQPMKLARRIREAIDEEGLVHQHEIEDSEAGEMIALAQDIVATEGTADDAASAVPKTATKKKRPTSIREYYAEDSDAWIMKPAASAHLRKLHETLASLLGEKAELTDVLRERLGASSLTLRWTPGLGHICHVKGKDARMTADVKTLSSSRTTRSLHLPEWTKLGERLDKIRFQIRQEEQRVFHALREAVVLNLVKLRRNAAVLDELDITTSFAVLAQQQNLVRPILNSSTSHKIVGGRHPTVEGGLAEAGRSFHRNDCFLVSPAPATPKGTPNKHGRIWLVTGPNMGGKSTFLRQNALITILAQVGCWVPASYAEIGIVDALFSRVGSADNLYADQSTFMVEMLETAAILRNATSQSFVIMDEIGRGTTPEDGTAVAFAALHHMATVNKCRALFATHFHAVADLAAEYGLQIHDGGEHGVMDMYCTDVEEDMQGGFVYVHKLRKGINRQSHALKVAKLAGLPMAAIQTARDVLGRSGSADSQQQDEERITAETAVGAA